MMFVCSKSDQLLIAVEFSKFGKALRTFWLARRARHVLCLLMCVCVSNTSYGIGLGAADTLSYIGQPVRVTVPLFNVQNPESLVLKLSSESALRVSSLSARIDRSNSQLSVLISSDRPFTEPYLNFSLDLKDDNGAINKQFTVLLNLAPSASATTKKANVSARQIPAAPPQASSQVNSSVLGPYDWAKKGQIPDQFGAVVDGQSLWRVARRINAAMGVSLNQMMWALYAENPDAFSDNTVSSLQAGSFLRIPNKETVIQFDDQQAKSNLAQLSRDNVARGAVANRQMQTELPSTPSLKDQSKDEFADSPIDQEARQVASPSFNVAGLEQANSGLPDAGSSQQIIGSLAQTVGNLTQELINKDKQISFLQEKVSALEAYAGIDSELLARQSALKSASDQIVDTTVPNVRTQLDSKPGLTAEVTISRAETKGPINGWQILALCVAATGLLAVIFRQRLAPLWSSLNIFRANDGVEFASVIEVGKENAESDSYQEPEKNYSIMHAVDHTLEDKETLEGISYLSYKDDGGFVETAEEPEDNVIPFDEEELSFEQRFNRLIKEKDYAFARELLEFSRHNDIEDAQYHCNRLRLCKAMADEDGFYEYYYEIESKIPQFEADLQTKISEMVVQVAQS